MEIDELDVPFLKKYRLIATTKNTEDEPRGHRYCRFCKKEFPDTTFTTKAHILPELLGRNNMLTYEECDQCNKYFSAYESHLATYFRPYLTLVGVKGKKGIPAFHSRTINSEERTRLKLEFDSTGQRRIQFGNLSDYIVDKESKTATLTLRIPPHKPAYIYKAFVKMALSMLPEDKLKKYSNVFDWLTGRTDTCINFPCMVRGVMPGKMFSGPSADLFEAAEIMNGNSLVPELTLVVYFCNIIVQVFLPLSDTYDYSFVEGKEPLACEIQTCRFTW